MITNQLLYQLSYTGLQIDIFQPQAKILAKSFRLLQADVIILLRLTLKISVDVCWLEQLIYYLPENGESFQLKYFHNHRKIKRYNGLKRRKS